ncbi:hypothetical protein TPHA_0F01410 [Tetrapisispora phaffii CBS 4417]|uniref:Mitochondrial thiamine pyrophosphate carrier 1 n=1 Tax=Tetrapisispora phaffii (strain ATCC 24235 / CBS 4417 / NBRC 1672 / NRRL Y-8282 / UCD 70-5) TaxID=1071381 RepID=G8BV43_TETPH|nr:hypothetical protein TPHA_0F01410 [Tetrapisispora phaffii CBS 4417]CCE63625.1 hypothetical protein TPHA_0F01410 [Tetrapisispora phaffii CBS 4417]
MGYDLSPLQKEFISGITTGCITTIVVHPLDLIKVRLQLSATGQGIIPNINNIKRNRYRLVLENIIKHEKKPFGKLLTVKEIYRGLGINILGNTIAWGLYFGLYRQSKDILYNVYHKNNIQDAGFYRGKEENSTVENIIHDQKMSPIMYLSAGAISGLITSVVTNPIWVLKTRIMSTSKYAEGSYVSIIHGFKTLLEKEGLKSFWRGTLPAVLGVSQGAIYFMVYDTLKYKYSSLPHNRFVQSGKLNSKESNSKSEYKLKNLEIIGITSLSKMLSVSSVYPFQLLKSNLQSFKAVNHNYTLINLAKNIFKEKGLLGLYTGLSANLLRAIPSTCITFCIYENFRNWI